MDDMTENHESNTGREAKKRDKPTILQVLPSLETGGGGVERGAVDVAITVARSGAKSLVASNGGAMVRELERAKVAHFGLPLHSKNPCTIFANIGRLEKIIREHEVDIVHVRSRAPAWSAFSAARRADVHFVTTFHGAYTGPGNFLKKHYNSITQNYKNSKSIFEELYGDMYQNNVTNLSDINRNIIESTCKYFEIGTNTILQSELKPKGAKSDLIIDICKKLIVKIKKAYHLGRL